MLKEQVIRQRASRTKSKKGLKRNNLRKLKERVYGKIRSNGTQNVALAVTQGYDKIRTTVVRQKSTEPLWSGQDGK